MDYVLVQLEPLSPTSSTETYGPAAGTDAPISPASSSSSDEASAASTSCCSRDADGDVFVILNRSNIRRRRAEPAERRSAGVAEQRVGRWTKLWIDELSGVLVDARLG